MTFESSHDERDARAIQLDGYAARCGVPAELLADVREALAGVATFDGLSKVVRPLLDGIPDVILGRRLRR